MEVKELESSDYLGSSKLREPLSASNIRVRVRATAICALIVAGALGSLVSPDIGLVCAVLGGSFGFAFGTISFLRPRRAEAV